MVKCPKCGYEVSRWGDARFCPNCGSPLPALTVNPRTRTIVFTIMLILCIFVTLAGTFAKIDVDEAHRLKQETDNLKSCVKRVGFQVIFGNNFAHVLIMFIPIAGPLWGFFVLYNTGRVIAALSMISGVSPIQLTFTMFLLPFTWMEYISYALAISEGLILSYSIMKRSLRRESSIAFRLLALCSAILLVAAAIEFVMITILGAP